MYKRQDLDLDEDIEILVSVLGDWCFGLYFDLDRDLDFDVDLDLDFDVDLDLQLRVFFERMSNSVCYLFLRAIFFCILRFE